MDYKLLTQEDQEEVIANFLLAQERDHHLYSTDNFRFKKMLETLDSCPFRDNIQKRFDDTLQRIKEVEAIIAGTDLPSMEVLIAAMERVKAKAAVRLGLKQQ